MRNSILSAALVSAAILGGIIGGGIQQIRDTNEIVSAWDNITVVADGQLIANPAAYALDPTELADKKNVRIISAHTAALDAAFNPTPRLVGFGCKGKKVPVLGVNEDDFPPCDSIVAMDRLPQQG